MSNQKSQHEIVDLENLATITGGASRKQVRDWNNAYRSGLPANQPGSTVDYFNRQARRGYLW